MVALRSVLGVASIYCISRALQTAPLCETVLLNNPAPLFVPLIIWLWHRTTITPQVAPQPSHRFCRSLYCHEARLRRLQPGLIFGLASGLAGALLLVVVRQIAHEPLIRTLFYYFLIFTLLWRPLFSWSGDRPLS